MPILRGVTYRDLYVYSDLSVSLTGPVNAQGAQWGCTVSGDGPGVPLLSLCVYRDAHTIPLGSLCVHRDVPAHKPPIKMPPTNFLPNPGFYVFILHILQETAQPSVCARQVRSSIPRNFGCLVAYLCRVVSLRQ